MHQDRVRIDGDGGVGRLSRHAPAGREGTGPIIFGHDLPRRRNLWLRTSQARPFSSSSSGLGNSGVEQGGRRSGTGPIMIMFARELPTPAAGWPPRTIAETPSPDPPTPPLPPPGHRRQPRTLQTGGGRLLTCPRPECQIGVANRNQAAVTFLKFLPPQARFRCLENS